MRNLSFVVLCGILGLCLFTALRVNEIAMRKPVVDTMYMITVPQNKIHAITPEEARKMSKKYKQEK